MEVPQPPQIDDDTLQHRAAVLAADRGFLDILRRMKWDVFKQWVNEHDPVKRDALFRDVQAVARLKAKIDALAGGDAINVRKTAAAAIKRRRSET